MSLKHVPGIESSLKFLRRSVLPMYFVWMDLGCCRLQEGTTGLVCTRELALAGLQVILEMM